MIVVSNRIPLAPGHEEAFAERFRGRAGLVEGHIGFVRLEILKPTEVATHGRAMGRCPYHVVLTYWDRAEDLASTYLPNMAWAAILNGGVTGWRLGV